MPLATAAAILNVSHGTRDKVQWCGGAKRCANAQLLNSLQFYSLPFFLIKHTRFPMKLQVEVWPGISPLLLFYCFFPSAFRFIGSCSLHHHGQELNLRMGPIIGPTPGLPDRKYTINSLFLYHSRYSLTAGGLWLFVMRFSCLEG